MPICKGNVKTNNIWNVKWLFLSALFLVTVHVHPVGVSDYATAGRSIGSGVPQQGEPSKVLIKNILKCRLQDNNKTFYTVVNLYWQTICHQEIIHTKPTIKNYAEWYCLLWFLVLSVSLTCSKHPMSLLNIQGSMNNAAVNIWTMTNYCT